MDGETFSSLYGWLRDGDDDNDGQCLTVRAVSRVHSISVQEARYRLSSFVEVCRKQYPEYKLGVLYVVTSVRDSDRRLQVKLCLETDVSSKVVNKEIYAVFLSVGHEGSDDINDDSSRLKLSASSILTQSLSLEVGDVSRVDAMVGKLPIQGGRTFSRSHIHAAHVVVEEKVATVTHKADSPPPSSERTRLKSKITNLFSNHGGRTSSPELIKSSQIKSEVDDNKANEGIELNTIKRKKTDDAVSRSASKEVNKKRAAVIDSDSDTDDGADDVIPPTPEARTLPAKMSRSPSPPPPPSGGQSTTSLSKVRQAVNKTYMNADGFMVTKTEYVVRDEEKENRHQEESRGATCQAVGDSTGPTTGGGKASGKQASIMNFFRKKS